MVRFIITEKADYMRLQEEFTFQYGQIYYRSMFASFNTSNWIYIPIWLDLLYLYRQLVYTNLKYLHSNMVRFIIYFNERVA